MKKSMPLVGFSGEVKQTRKVVMLPVYTKGMNQHTKFLVVDYAYAYSTIMGNPWIYDIGVIPSSFHQKIKFSTSWGIKEIRGKQENSLSSYQITLKGNSQ